MELSNVRFPLLRRVRIEGYELYPGKASGGSDNRFIDQKIPNGVTVVIGTNGIGKTTFLNLLFRLLVGPSDPSKSDDFGPGKTHELIQHKTFSYFADRVSDGASNAHIRGEFTIGGSNVVIERRLSDLRLENLQVDNKSYPQPGEEEYLKQMTSLTGVASAYDFDFITRNLLFFLEQRFPLIWSDQGQFEILRILFYPIELSNRCAQLYDDAQQADSIYRNNLWLFNKEQKKYDQLLSSSKSAKDTVRDLKALRSEQRKLQRTVASLRRRYAELGEKQTNLQKTKYRLAVDLDELHELLHQAQGAYFGTLIPTASNTAKLIIDTLVTDDSCLVCGTEEVNLRSILEARLNNSHCPVCDSHLKSATHHEEKHHSAAEVSNLVKKVEATKKAYTNATVEVEKASAQIESIRGELIAHSQELIVLEGRVRKLEPKVLLGKADLVQQRTWLDETKLKLDELSADRDSKVAEYKAIISQMKQTIENVASEVSKIFGEYARKFLGEECLLELDMTKRQPIGQGASVEIPTFIPSLTSGAFLAPHPRTDAKMVSESQKEFIDLAFRMSLLRVAARGKGGMLVIETPEASLDAVFIKRAGSMLRAFGLAEPGVSNVLIASCNLNGERMPLELLGPREEGFDVTEHVIDLIDIGKPGEAYQESKEAYDAYRTEIYKGVS